MCEVMISVQPKWCELIASGKKTVEVRKTKPKTDVPFKCYIYQTKLRWVYTLLHALGFFAIARRLARGTGKVIGEFVCRNIYFLDESALFEGMDEISNSVIEEYSCLSIDELLAYKGNKKEIYGWSISDLVIYDEPKELCEFFRSCGDNPKCEGCEAHYYSNTECGKEDYCCSIVDGHRPLKRPPQSWCYVKGGAE